MTNPEIITWAIVVGVGVPAAWRNPTAAALVIAWLLGQISYIATGNNLPTHIYLYSDIAVIAVVFAKSGRSNADWIVLAIFPAMWILYAINIEAYTKWWALFGLVLAQFLVVGIDGLLRLRLHAKGDVQTNEYRELMVAWR